MDTDEPAKSVLGHRLDVRRDHRCSLLLQEQVRQSHICKVEIEIPSTNLNEFENKAIREAFSIF